jgi:hypothetical protein
VKVLLIIIVVIGSMFFATTVKGDIVPPVPEDDPVIPSVTLVVDDFELESLRTQLRETRQHNKKLQRQLAHVKKHLKERWRPTVDYAIKLAAAVTGVSYYQLRAVASCESGFFAYAKNGKYKGIFQLGWSPFGFSPYDPVANALSAAMTVRHDGSWRQWECKP